LTQAILARLRSILARSRATLARLKAILTIFGAILGQLQAKLKRTWAKLARIRAILISLVSTSSKTSGVLYLMSLPTQLALITAKIYVCTIHTRSIFSG
jgi:hypothetical protein